MLRNTDPSKLSLPERVERLEQFFQDPTTQPGGYRDWLTKWSEVSSPTVVLSQIAGFTSFVYSDAVSTSESTTSTSYTNLATDGPSISVESGDYMLIYGAFAARDTGTAYFAPSINGAIPDAANALGSNFSTGMTLVNAVPVTATASPTTIKLQYKSSDGGTEFFAYRWIVALRYSEL